MQNLGHGHDSGCRNLKEGLEIILFFFRNREVVNFRHKIFKLRELMGSE
jgi:hypothetical protein